MLYSELVAASQRVASTAKRSEKVAALAGLLKATPPDEIDAILKKLPSGEGRFEAFAALELELGRWRCCR